MPIDPQRFPASNRPKVEIRRRTVRAGATSVAVTKAAGTATPASRAAESAVEEPYEPPTIFRLVFPDADDLAPSEELPATGVQASDPIETPVALKPVAIDSRQTLLGPSEMAVPEVPILRYDAAELAPMLEEMAVRKVLLEQTLVRMRQALDEENADIEREATAIVAERETRAAGAPVSNSLATHPKGRSELGAFFWLGSTLGAALLGWGMLWLLRGVLFDPSLLRTGGVLGLFGVIALGSNAALHLDALLPRALARGES